MDDAPSGRAVFTGSVAEGAARLPVGTVTFMFTDIEGSTRMVRELGASWRAVVEEHNRLMRDAVGAAGGTVVRTEGDAIFAVFGSASQAVVAAVDAQRRLASGSWPQPVRVRMGLHTGEGMLGGDDYAGLEVHRAARIAAAGHGGQVLLSASTRTLVGRSLPPGVALRGLGPHRLKDLPHAEELHQLVMEGLPSDFPAPKTMDVPTNLPAPRTTFVGRARELAQIGQLLEQTGLVTLTGTGGCGKTRLAIEAAAGLLPSYRDGIFFVDLATITNPDLVPSTIALALDVRQESSRPIEELLKDVLQDRETLLVLDNFEQVLEAAPVIAGLLSASPRLRVLVTSRAALHLSGEQEFPVPPLGTPDARDIPRTQELTRYEAIDLFVQRASRVDPNFRITDENSAAVAQICAQLDGLPLAIELAASRVKLLPPASMLKRLERRLALLTGGARDLPARQRTLRDTIGWSYDLLDREEQILFSRLATFVGGWTIEAAEAVANPDSELGVDTLDALGSLMDKSLIRRSDPDTESRFQMLGTIREFGIDKLAEVGDADLVRRRHALYYLELVTAAESGLTARDQGWRNRLESEHDNIRAALSWTIDARATDIGMGIVGALWRFWQMRGHLAEGRRWTDEVLGLPGAAARTATRAKALSASGSLAYWLRDTESVLALYRESLEIYREIRDRRGEAEAAYNLGFAHLLEGDVRAAKDLYETAAQMYRSVGDRLRLAQAVMALGMVAYHEGDLEKSDALTEEARAAFLDAGDLWGISMTAGQLGALALRRGEHERARRAITESLELNDKLGNRLGTSVGIQGLAVLAVRFGRPEAAVRLAGAVHRIREVAGGEAPRDLVGLEDPVDVAKRHLAADRIAALWNEGRAMSFEEALASARLEGSEPDDASVEAAPLSPREGATSNDEETTAAGDEAER